MFERTLGAIALIAGPLILVFCLLIGTGVIKFA